MGEERPAFKRPAEQKEPPAWLRDFREWATRLQWPSDWRHQLRWPAIVFGGLAGTTLIGGVVLFLVIAAATPNIPKTDLYALNRPQALTFTDEKGTVLGVRGAIVGERLRLSEMPPYLPAAFLAMEDRKFYRHHGVDPSGLFRAAMVDLKARHIVQGGSTITQQVMKIVLLSPDRTFSRKLTEIAGAFELERRLTKDQILELYLNRLYLGSGAYGVDGAAHVYFGKSARNVTLPEAAMLAALTRAPSAFSPRRDLAAAQQRANRVLTAMVANGAVAKEQAAQVRATPATIIDPTENLARDYYLDAAADEVKQLVPSATGDLVVTTAMDPSLQEAARVQIVTALNKRGTAAAHATQAALVSMTPDGAVRALIGGKDYAESAFNRVTKAHRQPGSAFKPFVYLAALEHGLSPATVRVDEPITIKNWSPDNYNDDHIGPVNLQDAFAQSINTVAVQLGQEVGLPNIVSVAQRLGIRSPLQPVASLALGTSDVTPLELTSAYASFASLGNPVHPYTVINVNSPNGDILYRHDVPPPARVLTEDEALTMNSMMYQVVQAGTGRAAAVPGHEVAGKTGTSADYRDAWFVGFSPELVTGVWVGNDDFSPMKKVTGGALPAQIWSGFMRVALKNVPFAHLARAEPVPPAIAESDSPDGENVLQRGLEGLGNFFDRLFNGRGSASANASPRTEPSITNPPNTAVASPPPRTGGETYVFENGQTGERQVFRRDAASP
ncbi:MAG TPA: PBP1A family penicillin-binding protein [Micropepsaceae bacterium]|nr:PBP1A family penicillin-binding protein [Micropepsaceae bacterium]